MDRTWWIPTIVVPLAVGLVLLVLEYRTKWFARSSQLRKNKDNSPRQGSGLPIVGISESDPGTISVGPSEIVGELKRLPPYQRPRAADCYRGLKIEWKAVLQNIVPTDKKNIVVVVMIAGRGLGDPWVSFRVNILKYPELRIAKKGQEFWVAGEISRITGSDIVLSNCVLRFD